jgi:hypothetical protein
MESFVLLSPTNTNTRRLKNTKLQLHTLSSKSKKFGLSPRGKVTDQTVCESMQTEIFHEFNILYLLFVIIRLVKSRRMRLARHVRERKKILSKFLSEM